ncbi:MAG: hypothetical protein ACR2IT_09350 [Pirellulales bacterium]
MFGSKKQAATVVICATAPRQPGTARAGAWLDAARGLTVPVTWLAGIDSLAEIASQGRSKPGIDLALDIPPAACGSKSKLRDLLHRAHDAAADVTAVVLRGPTPLDNRGLLVEHGIGVALVTEFEDDARGSRRPAPRGWPCRNAVWGLWEVQVTPHRPRGIAGWLGMGGMPQPKAGGLHVLRTEGVAVGNNGTAFITPRLERWVAWASQRRFGGTVLAGLSSLPAVISGEGRDAISGSVLRAA